jgi:hypothetical protein
MYQRQTSQIVISALDAQAAVVLLGPRQVGKTTLALEIAEQRPSVYLDLERDADRQILTEPDLYLDEQVGKLVILDEVQQMPDLFKNLRGQIDMRRRKGSRTGQFLLLGSASNVLLHQSAESLAGRVRYIEMPPLLLDEVGEDRLNDLWLRGGFPDSFQADSDRSSMTWREDFLRTYLEREWGEVIPPPDILLPKDDEEREIWQEHVQKGWKSGYEQADEIFESDLAQLTSDFEGMIRYRILLSQGMISPPYALQVDRGITGGGDEMKIGDRAVQITGVPELMTGADQWKPASR